MEIKYIYPNNTYNLSTDYNKLYELIKEGREIIAHIVWSVMPYNDTSYPVWELIFIKFIDDKIYIGRKGREICFPPVDNVSNFIDNCSSISLHYIIPTC